MAIFVRNNFSLKNIDYCSMRTMLFSIKIFELEKSYIYILFCNKMMLKIINMTTTLTFIGWSQWFLTRKRVKKNFENTKKAGDFWLKSLYLPTASFIMEVLIEAILICRFFWLRRSSKNTSVENRKTRFGNALKFREFKTLTFLSSGIWIFRFFCSENFFHEELNLFFDRYVAYLDHRIITSLAATFCRRF